MPARKKSSLTTKLTGFAIAFGAVVFCANNQMLINDGIISNQIPSSPISMLPVPVDGGRLSQRLLPALSAFDPMDVEDLSHSRRAIRLDTELGSNHDVSNFGPSRYELKLADQKAWSCQPRPASLPLAAEQRVQRPRKVDAPIAQSPIVPGHEDPHLRYESQFLELVVSLDGQQQNRITTGDSIELKEAHELVIGNEIPAPVVSKTGPTAPVSAAIAPASKVAAPPPLAEPFPAAAAKVARTWETGRY